MQGTRDLAEAVLRDAMGPEADGSPSTTRSDPEPSGLRFPVRRVSGAGFHSQRALADFRNGCCRGTRIG